MKRFARIVFALALLATLSPRPALSQDPASVPVFRSQVNLVSLAAVVRDRRGRIVSGLTKGDFEVFENGKLVPLLDVRSEKNAEANIALLVDGSGSMRVNDSFGLARQISERVLDSLDKGRDEAALYSFDTRVLTLHPFSSDLTNVRQALTALRTWGSTSLYDAISGVAGKIHERGESRRAIVVFTDGNDTTSTLPPAEVATITSALDVPVYAFALTPFVNAPTDDKAPESTLAEIARASGGAYFVVSDPTILVAQVTELIEELRHQHVLSFEASSGQGWRTLELRVRGRGRKIRTRGWYWSGNETLPGQDFGKPTGDLTATQPR